MSDALDTDAIRLVTPTVSGEGRQRYGRLEIASQANRAFWDGTLVKLTLAEFLVVKFMVEAGRDVGHRERYESYRGNGFHAGGGEDGVRNNARTFIKRIRQKFAEVDTNFDCIQTYPGFGYRWTV